jgi:hypothetical protein
LYRNALPSRLLTLDRCINQMSQKKKFLLRIDPKLYEVLESWAADEFRSVNTHIEFLLREAVRKAGRLPSRGAEKAKEKEENKNEA